MRRTPVYIICSPRPLVGAGPGDPDLLTIKALRALQDADVIFYDELVSPEVLDRARRDAARVPVGRRVGKPGIAQDAINKLLIDAAKSGQITFAVFHILGPSIASLDEIAETANFMQGAKYFLVKNFINNTSFFEWDQATYNSYFHRIKDATELTIPKLNEMAYEQVEVSSVPFR